MRTTFSFFTVYIQTSPEECLKRVIERGRSEEDGLPLVRFS